MNPIGKYFERQVFWLDYDNFSNQIPGKDWVCLAIANEEFDLETFDKFVRSSISRNILEFKGYGQFGEKLHDLFEETMVIMGTMENHGEIEVISTWHDGETIEVEIL